MSTVSPAVDLRRRVTSVETVPIPAAGRAQPIRTAPVAVLAVAVVVAGLNLTAP